MTTYEQLFENNRQWVAQKTAQDPEFFLKLSREQRPTWAEGWNKRATAHYLRGGYRASLLDIQETLRLEPRHFGALSGWAAMQQLLGDERGALRILQRLSRLCPQMPGLQARIRDLRDQLPEAEN
jgi:hypothetical protein